MEAGAPMVAEKPKRNAKAGTNNQEVEKPAGKKQLGRNQSGSNQLIRNQLERNRLERS